MQPIKKKRGRPRKVPAADIPPVKSVRELRNQKGEAKDSTFLAALPTLTSPILINLILGAGCPIPGG